MPDGSLIAADDQSIIIMNLRDRLQVLEQTAILPPGLIVYCATLVPDGWLVCDGSTFSAQRYGQLASKLGTTTLPNLRGRVVVGQSVGGTFPTLLGVGGEETHVLTVAEMPSHNHPLVYANAAGGSIGGNVIPPYNAFAAGAGNTDVTGGGAAHNNLPPYVVLLPIIKF